MIPVNTPLLGGNESKYLKECVESGWISSDGPFVERFENDFAAYLNVEHAIAVCNGTAALETALYAAGVGEGDLVVMPSFTIISCAIAALRVGAKPVLVDIDREIWCMDVEHAKDVVEAEVCKSKGKLKALMPVHIYGHPVFMDAILELADKHGLVVIEDAAEGHGSEFRSNYLASSNERANGVWRKCGTMGQAAAFSFYANKLITTGEGGMVVTDDRTVADRARSYRNLCFQAGKRFYHTELGYNFRMSNLQAAVGVAQVEQIERFIVIKRTLGEYYRKRISELSGVRFMPVKEWANPVYWMYSVELDPICGLTAEVMMGRLEKHGISTRPFFRGLHAQPALKELGLFTDEKYPKTDFAHQYGFYLPSGLALTTDHIDTVIEALNWELTRG